jgi:phosphoribosylanthranilate isomerase
MASYRSRMTDGSAPMTLQPHSKIHVKICGITNLEDARVASEAGADLLGFILYPKSPRFVEPAVIGKILREIQGIGEIGESGLETTANPAIRRPKTVGVFVNEPVERILTILDQTGLDYAQLHSDEPPAILTQLRGRAFRVLRPTGADEALAQAATYAPLGPTEGPALMIDAYDPTVYGGTGKTTDWHTAAAVARQHPSLLLAGGLTPENVAAAIRTVQPWGVDVSSGVEAAPGRKDHARVRAFIQAANR